MNIKVHGFLGKIFGNKFKLHVGNLNLLINAIDSVKPGFRKKLKDLNDQGFCYCTFFDRDANEMHIFPSIMGSGKTLTIIVGIILIVVAIVVAIATFGAALASLSALAGVVPSTVAGGFAALTTLQIIGLTVSMMTFSAGISLIVQGAMMSSRSDNKPSVSAVGGNAGRINAGGGKSYLFNSAGNKGLQGSKIPVGYGRVKIGSRIIGVATKNYSTTIRASNEFNLTLSSLEELYD